MSDSISYEQRYFLGQIGQGMPVTESRKWYESLRHIEYEPEEYDVDDDQFIPAPEVFQEDNQVIFAEGVMRLITSQLSGIPHTFIYDLDRINTLRQCYRQLFLQRVVVDAFCDLLHTLQSSNPPSDADLDELVRRVHAVDQAFLTSARPNPHWSPASDEIVRLAYKHCSISALPNENHLRATRRNLHRGAEAARMHNCVIKDELAILVGEHVRRICALTPLQILEYNAREAAAQTGSSAGGADGTVDIEDLALRVAHVAVLHWQIWGAILYLQPMEVVEGLAQRREGGDGDACAGRGAVAASGTSKVGCLSEDEPRPAVPGANCPRKRTREIEDNIGTWERL